jgi:hypothetical protein
MMKLRPAEHETEVFFLVGMPSSEKPEAVRSAASDALAILKEIPDREAHVLTEDESDVLAKKLVRDIDESGHLQDEAIHSK